LGGFAPLDNYVEQIVKKPPSGGGTALKILIIALAAVFAAVSVFLVFLIGLMAFVVALLAFYFARFIVTGLDCEYEYIVTNGELDVDKIIAKRRRKRLLSVRASDFERYGELKDAPDAEDGTTIVLASGLREDGGNDADAQISDYYADFKHKSLGKTRLVFSPDERVRSALAAHLPRAIRHIRRY
jgi:hypothetical protein